MKLFCVILVLLFLKGGQATSNPQCPAMSSFNFPNANQATDSVLYNGGAVPSFSQISVCLWVTLSPSAPASPPFISYQVGSVSTNEFLIIYISGTIRVFVVGRTIVRHTYTRSDLYTRTHLCVTVDASTLSKQFFINGVSVTTGGSSVVATSTLSPGGTLLLGQEQDSEDGGFASSQSFTGDISNVVMYDRVLTDQEITRMYLDCECPNDYIIAFTTSVTDARNGATATSGDCPVPFECSALTDVDMLTVSPVTGSEQPFTPGEQFRYSCSRGELVGDEFRTCQFDESYNGTMPTCEAVCQGSFFHFPHPEDEANFVVVSGGAALSDFTICMWISVQDFTIDFALFSYVVSSTEEFLWVIRSGHLNLVIQGSRIQMYQLGTSTQSASFEGHICATNEPSTGTSQLYVNMELQTGVIDNALTSAGVLNAGGTSRVGRHAGGSTSLDSNFPGNNISQVVIYDRVLSQAELLDIYMDCACPLDYGLILDDASTTINGDVSILDESCPVPVMCPGLTLSVSAVPYLELSALSAFPYTPGEQFQYSCTRGVLTGDELRTCQSDGTWSVSEPTCSPACPDGLFNFPNGAQTSDFVSFTETLPMMSSVTVCMWFQFGTGIATQPPLFSYQVGNTNVNEMLWIVINNLVFFADGRRIQEYPITVSDFMVNTHGCVTSDATDQTTQLFFNGLKIGGDLGGNDVLSTTIISPGGTLVLGQEQDSELGGFSPTQSFTGNISSFVIYDRVLSDQEVMEVYSNCQCPLDYIVGLTDSNTLKHGQATFIDTECQVPSQCPPLTLSASADPFLSLSPALGSVAPFTPGEQFQYSCSRGGLAQEFRTCQNDGSWSGSEPVCDPGCPLTFFNFPDPDDPANFAEYNGDSFPALENFTMCFWATIENSTASYVLFDFDAGGSLSELSWALAGGVLTLTLAETVVQQYPVTSSSPILLDAHICTTNVVAGASELFINMELQVATAQASLPRALQTSGTFTFGQGDGSGSSAPFFGGNNISNIVFYDRIVSQAELLSIYMDCECPLDYVFSLNAENVTLNGQAQLLDESCPVPVMCPGLTLSVSAVPYLELSALSAFPHTPGEQFQYSCTRGVLTGDELRTCQSDGTWSGSEPTCSPTCPENSFFHFPRTNQITDYVVYNNEVPAMSQFTVCAWFQLAANGPSDPAIISYQIGADAGVGRNDFLLILLTNSIFLAVARRTVVNAPFSGTFQDNTHICATIDSINLSKQIFFNGEELMENLGGLDILSTSTFNVGGSLILGQEQDAPLGGFDPTQSFVGNISNLVIYDRVLSAQEIMDIYSDCQCPLDYTVALTANNTREEGLATALPMQCPIPLQCPVLTLSVSAGPHLQLDPVTGSEEPYTPGEQFQYSCERGELVGDEFRTCQSNGEWTGTEPTCQPSCVSTLFHFPSGSSIESYVQLNSAFTALNEFTICLWLDIEQPTVMQNLTLISYYTTSEQILWQIRPNELVLIVNGRTTQEYTHMNSTFGAEIHMCATSSATGGSTSLYINGIEITPLGGLNPDITTTVEADGTFLLGQQQESNGGGFQAGNSFTAGNISNVVIWDRVFSASEVSNNYGNCECPLDYVVALLSDNVMLFGQAINPASSCPVPVECPTLMLSASASEYLALTPLSASPYTPGEQFEHSCTRGTLAGGNVLSTCQNNGMWLGSEPDCEATCPLSSFFHFPRDDQVEDYVQYVDSEPFPEISSISVCFWVELSDTAATSPNLFSYNTISMDNELTGCYISGNLEITINQVLLLQYTLSLTTMTHICFTSEPLDVANLYINSNIVTAALATPTSTTIVQSGGALILGQDQDSFLGGFEAQNSFSGNISSFIIWDRILTQQEITDIYMGCTCPLDYIVALTEDTTTLQGQAQLIPMSCPVPFECQAITTITDPNLVLNDMPGSVPPYTLDEQVVYSCTIGELQGNAIRTCQANETWAGQEPICFLECPAAEVNVPNLILANIGGAGDPYEPGEVIGYTGCVVGILVGETQRMCQSDETWSGVEPTCQNVTVNCDEMPEIFIVPQAYGMDSFAGYSVLISSDSRGNPDSCYPTNITDDLATFNISVDSCSPTVTDLPNYVVYTYTLWLHKNDRNIVQRYEDQCVSVTCNIDKTELVNSDYVNPVKTVYKIEGGNVTGVLNLPIGLYMTSAFDLPFSGATPSVAVPNSIYVRVGPVSVNNIIVQATQCWATPTANEDDEIRFDIIVDSCDYNGTMIQNYDVSADFSFESFEWTNETVQVIYVHCTVVLCNEDHDDGCRIPPPCAKRRKRYSTSDNEHLLTAGPIELHYEQNTLCGVNNGGCKELCIVEDMNVVCICSPGKLLSEDGFSCIDIVSEVEEIALQRNEKEGSYWLIGIAVIALALFVLLIFALRGDHQHKLFVN